MENEIMDEYHAQSKPGKLYKNDCKYNISLLRVAMNKLSKYFTNFILHLLRTSKTIFTFDETDKFVSRHIIFIVQYTQYIHKYTQ